MDTEKLWTLIHCLEMDNRLYSQAVERKNPRRVRVWRDKRDRTKAQIAEIIGKPTPY